MGVLLRKGAAAAGAGRPRFDANAKRSAALDVEIHAVFGRLSTAAVEQRLDDAQIANARMNQGTA